MSSTTVSQPLAAPRTWKKIAFYTVTALFVGLLVVFTGFLAPILPYLVTGWAIPPTETIHHLHEFLTSIFFWSLLIGAGAQFFNPRQRSAPLLQVVVIVAVMLTLSIVTGSFFPPLAIFLALGVLMMAFHPAGIGTLLQRQGSPNKILLGLVAVAVVPVLIFAADQLGMQSMHLDEHSEFFHWGASATIALALLIFGTIAALRYSGWKITAVSAGLIAIVFGITSIAFPAQASSIGALWGTLTIVWGAGFIGVAHFLPAALNKKITN